MIRSFDFKLGLLKMQLYFFSHFFFTWQRFTSEAQETLFDLCNPRIFYRPNNIQKLLFFKSSKIWVRIRSQSWESKKPPKIKKKKKNAKFIVIYSSVSLRFNHFLLIRNPNFVRKFTQRSNRRDTHRETESNLLHGKYMKKKP